ncbi:hypothetical protein HNQ77_002406 [Silvibacterium bohemicum]|uniref:Uncharacterized protein n=1 Tax=Silvibacterium bohemicum TaxID=1577686 RepID=A0A841K2H5_9BACT|nr:hypothetical protein [Silvibacterium bohemicum]
MSRLLRLAKGVPYYAPLKRLACTEFNLTSYL